MSVKLKIVGVVALYVLSAWLSYAVCSLLYDYNEESFYNILIIFTGLATWPILVILVLEAWGWCCENHND